MTAARKTIILGSMGRGMAKPVMQVRFVAEDISRPALQARVLERIKERTT